MNGAANGRMTRWISSIKVKEWGFDFIEIPLMRLDLFDPRAVKERLDGFGVTTSNVLLSDNVDVTSFDPEIRKKWGELPEGLRQGVRRSRRKNVFRSDLFPVYEGR